MHAAGLKTQTYFETFGQTTTYVVQVKTNPDGTFVKDQTDPQLTKRIANWYGWDAYDGTGEIHWAGPHGYFGNEAFSSPYTLTHPRYGSPPVKYPDGTVASGYNGAATDPRNSLVYDACAAKDVTGSLAYDYFLSTGAQQAGFVPVGSQPVGLFYFNKDSACPSWIDYARASALQAIDYGLDSMFTDNFSPWDSFGSQPVKVAFGEWSVATFRNYLAANFTSSALSAIGVPDVTTFDVRAYLRTKASTWSGSPITTGGGAGVAVSAIDRIWSDARWLDDPIWRAYKIHTRQTGTRALSNYYSAVKSAALSANNPDFQVTGNDFQGFNLGWARGDLDAVNSELSWTPSAILGSGVYGYMAPPLGSYVPVYKKAREHARDRFGFFWLYVPSDYMGHTGIADVLNYQALANHVMPEPWTGVAQPRTAGNDTSTAAFGAFVGLARPTFGERTDVWDIGVYYSSSSELAHMTLNGWPDTNGGAPHSLSFLGWGTALSWLHHQWRAIPEWKLTSANLSGLKLLVIPSSEVFDSSDLTVLQNWVAQGGSLIVTGNSGARSGESGNFEPLNTLSLAALTGVSKPNDPRPQVLTKVGSGLVLYIRDDIGIPFTNSTTSRLNQLSSFSAALAKIGFGGSVTAPSVPYTVGITLYDDAANLRRFVDINNTDIDLASDTIRPAPSVQVEVSLPPWLASKSVAAQVLTPDGAGVQATVQRTAEASVTIALSGVLRYASIVLQPSASLPQVTGVVNNATFAAGPIAPGSVASLFGGSFASGLLQTSDTPLPLSLAGVGVAIGGISAPLFFISPAQIGIQVPYETPPGAQNLVVTINDKPSNSIGVSVAPVAPYMLVTPDGRAIAQNPDYTLNGAGNGAPAGSYLVCYMTGIGVPSAPVKTGAPTPSDQFYHAIGASSATIGGQPATVLFVGLTPNFVGIGQANISVPSGLAPGDYPLVIELAGTKANVAIVTVR